MRHNQDAAVADATVADDARPALLADLLGRVAGCFPAGRPAVLRPDARRLLRKLDDLRGDRASRGGQSIEANEAHAFHLCDGKVVEFWDAITDAYAFDEFIG